MTPSRHFLIALVLLTIGFYYLFTFPNLFDSLYMTLLIIICNGIGGYNFGCGLSKIMHK